MLIEVMDQCICSECGKEGWHHWYLIYNATRLPPPHRNRCHECGNDLRFEDIVPEKAGVYYKMITKVYVPEELEACLEGGRIWQG